MKPFLTLVLFTVVHACSAQRMLIPYRSGNLFGLADESNKIIVTPRYDDVQWMQGSWFRTVTNTALNDTLEGAPGKFIIRNNGTVGLTGLINDGAIVLKDEPFDQYEIVANKCIVAKFERRASSLTKEQYKKYGDQRKFYSLFNLQGKNLYPENFKRIQKVDTAGISNKDKKTARYILFIVVHLDDRYSMFVFDADRQEISDWLVKDAFKITGDRNRVSDKQIVFSVTDQQGTRNTQILDYSTGKFSLQPVTNTMSSERKKSDIDKVEMVEAGTNSYDNVAVPPPDAPGISRPAPKFNPYHIVIKDTLYYLTGYENKHPVKLAAGAKILLTEPRGITQYQPVIVKSADHFYIVKEDRLSTTVYDSLIYFGSYFIAWRKINGQIKAGVINAGDSAIVPMEYDSIYAGIKLFSLENKNPAGKSNYGMVLREADAKYNYGNTYPYKRTLSNFLTVFKNGKCGVVSIKGDIIIPAEYEMIAKNNLQHSKPAEDDFILLKQNNRYGMASLQYSNKNKRPEISFIAAPVFEYIPGFFYPDYYGSKGYKLIGLYNEQMEFKGYASVTGKTFYKD